MDCSNRPFDWAGNVRSASKPSNIREMLNELKGVVGLPHEWRFAFQAGISWAGLSIASRTATLSRDFGNERAHVWTTAVFPMPLVSLDVVWVLRVRSRKQKAPARYATYSLPAPHGSYTTLLIVWSANAARKRLSFCIPMRPISGLLKGLASKSCRSRILVAACAHHCIMPYSVPANRLVRTAGPHLAKSALPWSETVR